MQKERSIIDKFYQSTKWIKCAKTIRMKYDYVCQECGKRGSHVHHKDHLTKMDYINKPLEKCYGEDNLTLLCKECHEIEHTRMKCRKGLMFNEKGELVER